MSVETTRAVIESYWSGKHVGTIAEDAVFTDMASGQRWSGAEAVSEMLRYVYEEAFDAEFRSERTYVVDGAAAVEGRLVGKHIGEFAGVAGTGRDVDVPLAVFYTVEDRGITEGRVWFMVSRFLEQVT